MGGEFYRGLPRGDFYRGSFKAFRRWGEVNSETGPLDLSLGPHISVLQGLTWRGGGEFYRGLPRGVFYRGTFKACGRGGQVNSETCSPIRHVSRTPYISSTGAILEGRWRVLYRGLPREDFYRGSFKVCSRWGQVNSETGPIRHVSWTPYISYRG